MQAKVSVYVIALILLASAVSAVVILPERASAVLTMRAPISINGDSDFNSANGVTGGSGTNLDPFVISGWSITSSSSNCIAISNTNAHFVIHDVILSSGTNSSDLFTGISIQNSTFGVIWAVTTTNKQIGIDISSSSYITVTNCSMSNVASYLSWYGVSSGDSSKLVIDGNNIRGLGSGVILENVTESRVSWNTITGTHSWSEFGIYLLSSSDCTIYGNIISNCVNIGIHLLVSQNNIVYHNDLIRNYYQAEDVQGSNNKFDAGYPSGGNYWSDYLGSDLYSGPGQNVLGPDGIGDSPYKLPDYQYYPNQDNYPLMVPFNMPNNPLVASFDVSPLVGYTNTNFTFDASFSSDIDEPTASLLVHWDWENDGIWDTNWTSVKIAYHQYPLEGFYAPLLEVKDSNGNLAETARLVSVSAAPPVHPPIDAAIIFYPDTLDLDSSGQTVTVYIELAPPYDVKNIDASTVVLLGVVGPSSSIPSIGDKDKDRVPDLMLKFDRNKVIAALGWAPPGKSTRSIDVTGSLFDGTSFAGSDVIKIINLEGKKGRANESSTNTDIQNAAVLGIGAIGMSAIVSAVLISLITMRKKME